MRITLPVEFSRIWELLSDFEGRGVLRLNMPLTMWARLNAFGELHFTNWAQGDDFLCMPTKRHLRILVGLRAKEFTLRWCDPEHPGTKSHLGGVFHDNLLRHREEFEAVKTGWMMASRSSHLEIY